MSPTVSEELRDEVEAINSIYGDGCLVPSADANVYILKPPGQESSIRIEFPESYPAEPPTVLGTHSTGEHGKRGDAVRELSMFLQALETVYQPGAVCLFDAIEELAVLLAPEEKSDSDSDVANDMNAPQRNRTAVEANNPSFPEPQWTVSDAFVELTSVFVAHCAVVSSPEEAEAFLQHLFWTDKKVRNASHNMTAWRIKGPNNTSFQDCNDDGEAAAGGRLLHLMQLMDLWNVMVVVTRWFNGQHIGPRRFALINQAARDAFVKAGLVPDNPGKKKGSKNS
ncbi:UPF0029-domain-containing protein [Xylariaceae sp. FL0662B]|nr:UPF0029-domain-containing protein [Xylariaceae sp. FL0662B]